MANRFVNDKFQNYFAPDMIIPINNHHWIEREQQPRMELIPRDRVLTKPPRPDYFSSRKIHSVPDSHRSSPIKPLRIVIIRHAERVDAVLGSDWSKKSFNRSGRYIRSSEHLPESLPSRSYPHHYVIDVPLTNRGRVHSFKTGKALQVNGYDVDVCYSSPSIRCVQTANGILSGMDRKHVPIQLEPGLFECYLNDFKRTLCFMTKEEFVTNGYNIDKSYQALMPFMRPRDSQLDYYERCRIIMEVIAKRHQATGGTILIVAHAPSLEGLTRHLSGGKLQPERLFEIARRVPFLGMTIIERNRINSPWLFRTRPLQTGQNQSISEVQLHLAPPATPVPASASRMEQQRRTPVSDPLRYRASIVPVKPVETKRILKSSTAPNLPSSHPSSNIFSAT